MGYAASPRTAGPLLALPAGDARGVGVALPAPRTPHGDVRIVPVINPAQPDQRGSIRSSSRIASAATSCVRSTPTGGRPDSSPMPLVAPRRVAAARPAGGARQGPGRPPRRPRRPRPRVEDIDELSRARSPEARDAWEDAQDEAWHPDDAAEARTPRQRHERRRSRTAAAAGADSRRRTDQLARRAAHPRRALAKCARAVDAAEGGYHERQLQFTPFEHPDTCRFIEHAQGEGHRRAARLHHDAPAARPRSRAHSRDGTWARAGQTWFERHYGVGPARLHARTCRTSTSPSKPTTRTARYNWELFFHAPLQVAVRLAKDGRHEEAQRWFHFIFDPTTDSSAPSPQRYWRFAPFYENNEYDSARELMHLLSYGGNGQDDRSRARPRCAISCRPGGRSRSRRTSSPACASPPIRRRW